MGEQFPWLAEYSVGIAAIDGQHQRLVAMINELHQALLARRSREVMGAILSQLVDYTELHFTFEESLMARYDYPGHQSHQEAHEQMRAKVLALRDDHQAGRAVISLAVMAFLKDWLSGHILGTDHLYKDFFQQEGLR